VGEAKQTPQSTVHEWISVSWFYRATLCISAVFAVVRCLSACPSVTFVYCIQMAEVSSNFSLGLVIPPF